MTQLASVVALLASQPFLLIRHEKGVKGATPAHFRAENNVPEPPFSCSGVPVSGSEDLLLSGCYAIIRGALHQGARVDQTLATAAFSWLPQQHQPGVCSPDLRPPACQWSRLGASGLHGAWSCTQQKPAQTKVTGATTRGRWIKGSLVSDEEDQSRVRSAAAEDLLTPSCPRVMDSTQRG